VLVFCVCVCGGGDGNGTSIFDKTYVKPLSNAYVTVSLWFQIGSDLYVQFVGTFAKFRKANISFGMSAYVSVRPSVRPRARNN